MDVVFFVKAGFQLYQNCYLFAVFRRFNQRSDDRRVAADTIQGLLNSKNIFVRGSLSDEIYHRLEGFIRVVNHPVFLLNDVKKIVAVGKVGARIHRHHRCKAHGLELALGSELAKEGQVDGTRCFVNLIVLHLQGIAEKFLGLLVALLQQLQANGATVLPLFDGLFNLLQ